ncbi:MAG: hypothetical protein ACP5O2_06515 [Bacteroidales bacterium]
MTQLTKVIRRTTILMLLIGWFSTQGALAQQAKAIMHIDTLQLLIGQPTQAQLKLEVPQGSKVKWGIQADTISRSIEILKKGKIDTTTAAGTLTLSQQLTLTSFDTGYIPVPPIRFLYQLPGDTTIQIAETEPLLLQVMLMEVDTAAPIRDIRGIEKVGYSWKEFLPWLLYILLAALIGLLIYRYIQYRRGKRDYFLFKPKPQKPAWQIALEALEELRQLKLWQSGQTKEYYSRLTDIFRDYLKGQFEIEAPEMVSQEIVDSLRKNRFEPLLVEEARRMLETADLVKFARFEPLADENDFALEFCRRFVEMTMPAPEPLEGEGQGPKEEKRIPNL